MARRINKALDDWNAFEEKPIKLCAITVQKDGKRIIFDRDEILKRVGKKKIEGKGSQVVDPKDWLFHKSASNRSRGKETNYMHLLFFMTWLDGILHSSPDFDHWMYKPLSTSVLKRYFPYSKGQLQIIINLLIAAKVIEVRLKRDGSGNVEISEKTGKPIQSYKVDGFAKQYRIHGDWKGWNVGSEWKQFDAYDTRGGGISYPAEKWLFENEIVRPKNNPDIADVWKENLLKIDLMDEALEAYRIAFEDEQNVLSQKDSRYQKKRYSDSRLKKVLSFAAMSLRDKPREKVLGNFSCNWNEATGRVYHSYSQYKNMIGPDIPDEPDRRFSMRRYLRIKGSHIYQIDVRSAHAFLLVKLYEKAEEFVDEIWKGLFSAATEPVKARKNKLKSLEEERRKYVKLFSYKRDFYLTIGKHSKMQRPEDQSEKRFRDSIKNDFWSFLFGDVKKGHEFDNCIYSKFYSEQFGNLYATINYLKSNWWMPKDGPELKRIQDKFPEYKRERQRQNAQAIAEGRKPRKEITELADLKYRQLAYFTQQLEGKIMLEGVSPRLAKWSEEKNEGEGGSRKKKDPANDIWHVTLHDAIWTLQSAQLAVRRVMKEEWSKVLGDAPHLEGKLLD